MLDHADQTAPALQHDLGHHADKIDQGPTCSERYIVNGDLIFPRRGILKCD